MKHPHIGFDAQGNLVDLSRGEHANLHVRIVTPTKKGKAGLM